MKQFLFGAGLLAMALTSSAWAQKVLSVGDQSPLFDGDQVSWILPSDPEQAPKVDMKDGKVHVLFFWDVESQDAREVIPLLSRQQTEWGEDRLQIIGVASGRDEAKDATDEWVRLKQSQITFPMCFSELRGPMRAFYKAAKLRYMPAMFLVGPQGRIQFIGSPKDSRFVETAEKVMRGRFDVITMRDGAVFERRLRDLKGLKNWNQYEKVGRQMVDLDPKIFVETEIDLYQTRLIDMQDPEGAAADAAAFVDRRIDSDPEAILLLVQRITNSPQIPDEKRDLVFALAAAERVQDRFDGNPRLQAMALRTLAEVRFQREEFEEAIRNAKKAYRIAPRDEKEDYRVQWVEYKQHADS